MFYNHQLMIQNNIIRETISFCLVYLIASVIMILKKQWLSSYLILMFRWKQMMLKLAIVLDSQVKINQRKRLSFLWTGSTVEKSWKTKKKMASIDFCKYKFPVNTKIFTNKDLTFKNETLDFHGRKLTREGHIFSSCLYKKIWKI